MPSFGAPAPGSGSAALEKNVTRNSRCYGASVPAIEKIGE